LGYQTPPVKLLEPGEKTGSGEIAGRIRSRAAKLHVLAIQPHLWFDTQKPGSRLRLRYFGNVKQAVFGAFCVAPWL
ncbi:MAG: hypothetical protein J2P13_08435, partial [Acidobacteria bacterium]|nr:hypothetical protein [Acidobacteriota bacterium]